MPARSTARCVTVCGPGRRSSNTAGVSHSLNPAPSSEHSMMANGSSEAKPKYALGLEVVAAGLKVMVVSGARRSIMVHS